MIKSVIIITIIACLVSSAARSQPEIPSGVRRSALHLGLSFMNVQEETLNRVIHRGPGLLADWYLELSGKKGIHIIELGMGSGFLKSDYEEEFSSIRFSGSAGFTYLGSICIHDPNLYLYLGGKVKAGTAIEYFDNWDESHFYWATSYSAAASFRFEYTAWSKGMFRIEADIPFISWVSRPPGQFLFTQSNPALLDVLKDLNHNLSPMSPSGYREFDIRVKYFFRSRKSVGPAIFWRLQYMRIDKYGSARMKYINQAIGIEFLIP